jgi:vacuolar-type H+-ATPase subunit E/Vma4
LANLRSELVEELFSAIADKLNKYVESDLYKQRLARELDETSKKYRSADAYLTRRDYDYLSSLPEESTVRDVTLKIGETRMIGGFILICPRDGIKIDKSFITTLEEAKSGFSLIKIV